MTPNGLSSEKLLRITMGFSPVILFVLCCVPLLRADDENHIPYASMIEKLKLDAKDDNRGIPAVRFFGSSLDNTFRDMRRQMRQIEMNARMRARDIRAFRQERQWNIQESHKLNRSHRAMTSEMRSMQSSNRPGAQKLKHNSTLSPHNMLELKTKLLELDNWSKNPLPLTRLTLRPDGVRPLGRDHSMWVPAFDTPVMNPRISTATPVDPKWNLRGRMISPQVISGTIPRGTYPHPGLTYGGRKIFSDAVRLADLFVTAYGAAQSGPLFAGTAILGKAYPDNLFLQAVNVFPVSCNISRDLMNREWMPAGTGFTKSGILPPLKAAAIDRLAPVPGSITRSAHDHFASSHHLKSTYVASKLDVSGTIHRNVTFTPNLNKNRFPFVGSLRHLNPAAHFGSFHIDTNTQIEYQYQYEANDLTNTKINTLGHKTTNYEHTVGDSLLWITPPYWADSGWGPNDTYRSQTTQYVQSHVRIRADGLDDFRHSQPLKTYQMNMQGFGRINQGIMNIYPIGISNQHKLNNVMKYHHHNPGEIGFNQPQPLKFYPPPF